MDKARQTQARISNSHKRGILASAVFGMISGGLFSFAFIAVMALLAFRNPDPTRLILPFSYICILVCGFFSGYSGAKFRGSSGFLSGLLSGCLFSFLLFILSQFFRDEGTMKASVVLFTYSCMILLSALGAIFATRKKHTKNRRRHR